MLCHTFLIGKGHTCALRTTCVLGGYTAASGERERMQGNTHLHSRYRPHNRCLTGEVYCGNRHYNGCEHVGLRTGSQTLLWRFPPRTCVLARVYFLKEASQTRTRVPCMVCLPQHNTVPWYLLASTKGSLARYRAIHTCGMRCWCCCPLWLWQASELADDEA
jgi:hypothetical protein